MKRQPLPPHWSSRPPPPIDPCVELLFCEFFVPPPLFTRRFSDFSPLGITLHPFVPQRSRTTLLFFVFSYPPLCKFPLLFLFPWFLQRPSLFPIISLGAFRVIVSLPFPICAPESVVGVTPPRRLCPRFSFGPL